jgi:3-deoxy-D-manno-octulosonic-acid transferase
MLIFYNLGTQLYFTIVRIAALFNEKAAKMIRGRENWRDELKKKINPQKKYIWFHCASLGEFEQGRPLIEKIKENISEDYQIIITFFSPSGYEIRKNYEVANIVCYLPFDGNRNARDFVEIVKPSFAVFVKYEFWYHMLFQLKKKDIPVFLISGIFRKKQIFFRWYGTFYRKSLNFFTHIFLQNKESYDLLKTIGISNTDVCGDTRTDRVISIAKEEYENKILEKFTQNKRTIVFGSSWPADEKIFCEHINSATDEYRFIIVPHEIDEKHLRSLESIINLKTVRYSKLNDELDDSTVIIIDKIGILSKVYRYGQMAYIGGGFGKGIHNILEAVVYKIPVVFGPKYSNFREACDLVQLKVAFSIKTANEYKTIVSMIFDDFETVKYIQNETDGYIISSFGATDKIFNKMHLIVKNDLI